MRIACVKDGVVQRIYHGGLDDEELWGQYDLLRAHEDAQVGWLEQCNKLIPPPSRSADIVSLDDMRPALTIELHGQVHVIPMSAAHGVISGRIPLESETAQQMLRAMLADWISELEHDGDRR